jgi:hypothetical protein
MVGPQPPGPSASSRVTSTRTGWLGRLVMVGRTFRDRPTTPSPTRLKFCGALAPGQDEGCRIIAAAALGPTLSSAEPT